MFCVLGQEESGFPNAGFMLQPGIVMVVEAKCPAPAIINGLLLWMPRAGLEEHLHQGLQHGLAAEEPLSGSVPHTQCPLLSR